ncbi:non-ribosomal peptide synthetase [Dactylosporangium sp. NPDC005555]|uniref:non-ribosomal peptide synthetase n=1 Tax=Dactylosporangium sp. NPDC005555 TaxID=3154889 RepID=UPI0033A7BACD
MTADLREPVTAPADTTYRRAVSATDWWFVAHPRRIPPVIQTVVEGAGTLDVAGLTAAVEAAGAANPGTRLRREGQWWVDSGRAPGVRVIDGHRGPVAELAALHDPLPTAGGAWCEVLWCPGDRPALVFRASHAVMDGKGKSMWIADVFRALRGEPLLGATGTITDGDVFDRLGITNAESKPDVWFPSPLGRPGRGGHRTVWARRTVDGYHPALTAKVATALRDAYSLDTARFAVAFDLRRHAPQTRTTGNLLQTELFDVTAGEPWEALHERLLAAMAESREVTWRLDPNLLKMPVPALRTLIRFMEAGRKDKHASATVLSHLGRADLAEHSTGTFEARTAYLLPLLAAVSSPEVNSVECGGRTELTLTWRDGPGVRERMEAALDAVASALTPRAAQSAVPAAAPAWTVVDRFAEVVKARPDAVALRWPGGSTTFAELDARSDVVAARLLELGAGRGAVVGLLADRSMWTVTGLWGVLKAGAAYLPLDAGHPDARIAALLDDAGANVCLVRAGDATRTPDGCTAVVLDDLPAGGAEPFASEPSGDDLAYVIYTSGSTGAPKGVEIEHAALANYVDWTRRVLAVDEDTHFALFTSPAFDLPNTALFSSTLAGGTLVLIPDEPSHVTLRHLLEESGANALKLTPSHLDLIGRLDVTPAGFRLLVVGGEPLRPAVAARARAQFGPATRLFNHYGPTEATVGCVVHPYHAGRYDSATVPIGRPAANCTVHVLAADRRPVAEGDVGELHIGGAQLARGYRGRPDLTRERFVHLADGTRVYRTGDLGRVLPSGEIECLGRADDQVKVAGYRVEPAEVAAALEAHPEVRRAVVVARAASSGGGKVLCGYVAADPGTSTDELRAFLSASLPRYMLPASIERVDAFPQTPNGKIDLSALPDPVLGDALATDEATDEAADDGDEVREAVAKVWARVLDVDAGRLDGGADFHQLGGDSVLLLAMLAGVCGDVVGAGREAAFMTQLGRIIRRPTLDGVSDVARETLRTTTDEGDHHAAAR